MEYILGAKEKECVFCRRVKQKRDDKNLILCRGQRSFVILNKYPYSNGHLMVVPYKHAPSLTKLDRETYAEMLELVARSSSVLKKTLKAQGFNIGVNEGKVAGAGVEDHVHFHIVPRWLGDTNFMPVVGDIRVMPEHLQVTYKKLKKGWSRRGKT